MSRVREAPAAVKILLIAIVLILLPGAILSYVSYVSVNDPRESWHPAWGNSAATA